MRPHSLVQACAFLLAAWLSLGFARHSDADDPKGPTDAPKPPPGWKEHSPADGTFVIWVPEKANRRSERSSSRTVNGVKVQINTLLILNNNGPNYVVEEGILSPNIAKKLNRGDLENLFRDEAAKVVGGRVTDEKDATVPGVSGKDVAGKEYRIEGKSIARVRIFVVPNRTRVFIARIEGSKDQVESEEAKVYLESARLTPAKNPAAAGPHGRMVGNQNQPEFKDTAPEGGILVGLEVGLAKFGQDDQVKTIRPVYRVGDKETPGMQYGKPGDNVVKVVAKPGYAVGEVSIRAGIWVDGLSVKFMRISEGKLDPKDAYESEWVGSGKGNPVKLGLNGSPITGVVGRANRVTHEVSALGFLFKEAEKK